MSHAVEVTASQLEVNLDDISPAKPPESLYSWVVMLASFICMIIVDGTCYSYGFISKDLEATFGSSKMTVSLAGSLITGSYLFFGPVASGLCNFCSHRTLVMVGGLISFLAIAASSFLDNVLLFILVFGVLGGFGFSLIYLPASTIITLWFYQKRGTAVGISACGSGIGGIIFSQIVPLMLEKYSWRGCLFMIAALALHALVAGALMIPLKNYETIKALNQVKKFTWTKNDLAKIHFPNNLTNHSNDNKDQDPKMTKTIQCGENDKDRLIFSSTSLLSQLQMGTVNRIIEEAIKDNKIRSTISLATTQVEGLADAVTAKLRTEISRPVHRQDFFYSGSMSRIPQYLLASDVHEYIKSVQAPAGSLGKKKMHPIMQMMKQMINLEILKSPTVVLVIISAIFAMVGYLVPYQFIPGYANNLKGLKKSAGADIISALSLANTIGRIGAGLITDLPFVNPIWMNNVSLLLSGVTLMMMPLTTSYFGLMSLSIIYGAMIAVFVSIRMMVLVQLIGLEKLTNALGVLLLFQGISMMISTPLLARFYDESADFTMTFLLGGAAIVFSGLFSLPLICLARWERSKSSELKQVTICDCFRDVFLCCHDRSE